MVRSYYVYASFLLCSLLFVSFTIVYAEEVEDTKNCLQYEMEIRNAIKVHADFYHEMLVHRYAPAELKYWQSVRSERDLLHKKLKEAAQFPYLKEKDERWEKKHRKLQEAFKKAVERRDETEIRKLLPQIIKHDDQLNQLNKQRLKMIHSSSGK